MSHQYRALRQDYTRVPAGPAPAPVIAERPRCVNANEGSFGHECSKPADVVVTRYIRGDGYFFRGAYCADCYWHGTDGTYCRTQARLHPDTSRTDWL